MSRTLTHPPHRGAPSPPVSAPSSVARPRQGAGAGHAGRCRRRGPRVNPTMGASLRKVPHASNHLGHVGGQRVRANGDVHQHSTSDQAPETHGHRPGRAIKRHADGPQWPRHDDCLPRDPGQSGRARHQPDALDAVDERPERSLVQLGFVAHAQLRRTSPAESKDAFMKVRLADRCGPTMDHSANPGAPRAPPAGSGGAPSVVGADRESWNALQEPAHRVGKCLGCIVRHEVSSALEHLDLGVRKRVRHQLRVRLRLQVVRTV